MPYYNFKNSKTDELREVMIPFSAKEIVYRGENGDEDCWERIWEPSAIRTETKNR